MSATLLRRIAVLAAVVAAIAIPALQQMLALGISQAAFAAQGDSVLRAEGYAFAIWGLIYLGLAVYAVYQLRARDTVALARLGWPAAGAAFGCGVWIVAASANWMWPTVAIIVASAAAAIGALLSAAPHAAGKDRALAVWPVAALAGWLTIAAPLNLVTVLTAMGMIGPASAMAWAVGAVAAVVAVGGVVAMRSRAFVYPLPIAWGLAAVFVAERGPKPAVAAVAAAAALVMLGVAMLAARKRA